MDEARGRGTDSNVGSFGRMADRETHNMKGRTDEAMGGETYSQVDEGMSESKDERREKDMKVCW